MKVVAIGTVASWLLLGTTVGSSASVVQYGALGLLAFVVVWVCTKGFPALLKSQKSQVDELKEAIYELKQEIRVLKERIPGN